MNVLLTIGIAMAAGLLVSRLARLVKLPNVTAFLVAGLVIGPCVGRIITEEQAASMNVISEAALGFIAYAIGGEFKLSYLKKMTITARDSLSAHIFLLDNDKNVLIESARSAAAGRYRPGHRPGRHADGGSSI